MKSAVSFAAALVLMCMPIVASAETFSHPLAVGSTGLEVTALQAILVKMNLLKVAPTSYFGTLTKKALQEYQKASGLEAVGSVGPKTRMLLNAYLAASLSAGTTVQTPPPTPTLPSVPVPTAPEPPTAPPTPASTANPNDPPKITLVSPTGNIPRTSSQTTLSVTTDKPAYCRYGTQPNMGAAYMTPFVNTGSTVHSTTLTSLAADGYYVYYVRCEDYGAHVSMDLQVSFMVNAQ